MGDMNFTVWIATIKGRQYVYFRSGSRKTRYLGPLEAVYALVEKLAAKGVNKAALQLSAVVKTTFDEARELAKTLKDFIAELRARIKRDLEIAEEDPSVIDASTIARAAALEVAINSYSGVIEEVWFIVMECMRRNEVKVKAFYERLLRVLRRLVEE